MAEAIEAAVRCEQHELARRLLDRLAEMARASGTDWALGDRGTLARPASVDGEGSDDLYRKAIERLARTRLRFELARAHLVYGEWLRRRATAPGRPGPVAHRARDVHSDGDRRVRRTRPSASCWRPASASANRSAETADELTAQEAQIARLARDGLSNTEIGERLFISQHTVAYHLRKVFSKLGITSRTQLRRVPPDTPIGLVVVASSSASSRDGRRPSPHAVARTARTQLGSA